MTERISTVTEYKLFELMRILALSKWILENLEDGTMTKDEVIAESMTFSGHRRDGYIVGLEVYEGETENYTAIKRILGKAYYMLDALKKEKITYSDALKLSFTAVNENDRYSIALAIQEFDKAQYA